MMSEIHVIEANKPAQITIGKLQDISSLRVKLTKGTSVCYDPCTIDNSNGIYRVNFTLRFPGQYSLRVKLGDKDIQGSPYFITVIKSPGIVSNKNITSAILNEQPLSIDPKKCITNGPGLHHAVQNEETWFEIAYYDNSGKKVSKKELESMKPHIQFMDYKKTLEMTSQFKDFEMKIVNGQWKVSYVPKTLGLFYINLKVNNINITNSPFLLEVTLPIDIDSCYLNGTGVSGAVVNNSTSFEVAVLDSNGDYILPYNKIINVMWTTIDGNNATSFFDWKVERRMDSMNINYKCNKVGEYNMTVIINNESIKGCPYSVKIMPNEISEISESNQNTRFSRMVYRFVLTTPSTKKPSLKLTQLMKKTLVSFIEALVPLRSIIKNIDYYKDICIQFANNNLRSNLSKDEIAAIHLYTLQWPIQEDSFYFILNEQLRNPRKDIRPFELYITLFLSALHKLPKIKKTVYRIINYHSGDIPNMEIVWDWFSSCTSDFNVLQSFLGDKGRNTLFLIKCKKGVNISKFSYYPQEKEILLTPSRFKVTGRLDNSKFVTIQLKECDNFDKTMNIGNQIIQPLLTRKLLRKDDEEIKLDTFQSSNQKQYTPLTKNTTPKLLPIQEEKNIKNQMNTSLLGTSKKKTCCCSLM